MTARVTDYLVIGAGSAGCVLAGRLSQDPDVRVTLVEAGPVDTNENIHVPLGAGALFRSTLDWDYDTHDEPFLGGRRLYLPRGRVLGGTSSMNGMVYMRGNPADYDGWGLPGWTFADLLPYFIKSEDNERGASRYHGAGGPLAVSEGRSNNPMSTAFVEAAVEAGYAANDDFNGAEQHGFGRYQLTQRDGRRCSSATAYLTPAAGRPNLTVETNVQVHRILVEGGRAVGVVGARLDEEIEIRAEREVIVCAGAYNSPQLLLLSGIGPADELAALGIPVVADLPVGRGLQDHPSANLVYPHSHPISLLIAGDPKYQREYAEHGTGPLSSNVPEAGGFVSTDGSPVPDVQFHASPLMLLAVGLEAPTDHAISFGPCVLSTRSRGTVTLSSADPTVKPRIRHNYYADDADLRTMVAGLRVGLEIARQRALSPYTGKLHQPPESDSDADLREYARRNTQTLFHPAGTCAMGTVLDAELRVQGVEGLRVVDASAMPTLVRGNTNAPIIAMAEKAVDLITA
ncbi:choline dehydrogenase-like flavoprotein [Actinokineospora baliensis]|uniref:GMC family oxidoreductase n=1 Tax=Actinokineospora baliensis TaxID=547056 RepID=UPI001EF83FAE|nr:GMC family oxidoreductase N-terminal domain-containing protein [Actinokineospora baliensis]MBM7774553.1 choline dehydrogenase-like flavoprotein [Actinokineospora baliensis]